MSQTKPEEPKKWTLTEEEKQVLTGMANVVGFIGDLIEGHMSKWIDQHVKTRLSIPPEQLVHVSIEKGEVTLAPENDKSKINQPGVHAGIHEEKAGKPEKSTGVQPSDEKVEAKEQTQPSTEQPAVLPEK